MTAEDLEISETNSRFTAVILAAGKSTRMKSRLPKPLHPLCGLPISRHVINACRLAGANRIIVIVGHEADIVKAGLGADVEYGLQPYQLGSGDAARCASSILNEDDELVLILAGDVPLIKSSTIRNLIAKQLETSAPIAMLTAHSPNATGYGRIVRDSAGNVTAIVEEKDASSAQRAIQEWNPSIYCFKRDNLQLLLPQLVPQNAQGELYLTDIIGLTYKNCGEIATLLSNDADELMGINNRIELAEAERQLRIRLLNDFMLSGVTIVDPASTYIDAGVTIGQDTIIHPQTYLQKAARIGSNCNIGPGSRILGSEIGENSTILLSQVVDSILGKGVKVGPFSNIRPKCVLGDGTKIGDFVELKNARLGTKVSASHLSYIGDAEVGDGTNIGAGVVTCNYDGVNKHRTVIGKGAFIGTHATLVAPITIGDGAFIGAGSPITQDVPDDALAVARTRQMTKAGWAKRRRERDVQNG